MVDYEIVKAREAQKELNWRMKRTLHKWKPEGSKEEYIKNFYMIINWNRSAYYYRINKRDKFKCQECGIDLIKNNLEFETHHIIPRSKGGSEHPRNLITLCKPCHRKHTNHLLNFKSAYDSNQKKLGLDFKSHQFDGGEHG